jgi:hypothetical protein
VKSHHIKRAFQVLLAVLVISANVSPALSAEKVKKTEKDQKTIEKAKKSEKDQSTLENLEYDRYFFEKKKDPIFAGILSWYVPGLGQYYSGEIIKGTTFLVVEYGLIIGAVFYFLNFDFAAGSGSGFNIKVDAKRTDLGFVETSRRNVFIGIMAIVFGIHLYNISDAVKSARNANVEMEKRRIKLKELYPFLDISCNDGRRMNVGLEIRF